MNYIVIGRLDTSIFFDVENLVFKALDSALFINSHSFSDTCLTRLSLYPVLLTNVTFQAVLALKLFIAR